MSRESILTELKKLAANEEEEARHLFIVCGQPSTVEGFHAAWLKEDPSWFSQWTAINATIGMVAGLAKYYE